MGLVGTILGVVTLVGGVNDLRRAHAMTTPTVSVVPTPHGAAIGLGLAF